MRKRMWMGPRGYEQWVPMPAIDPAYTRAFWTSSTPLLNGGQSIRSSKNGHNAYAFTWNKGSWDDIMPVRDMADGVWDSSDGVNLIYFLEPTSMRRNVLPQFMATPHLGSEDAPPLLFDTRPTTRREAQSVWNLPARSALYPTSSAAPQRVYVPIPPDFTAHFGWVGDAGGNGQVQVFDVNASGTNGAVHTPDALDGSGGIWTNLDLPRASGRIGVEVGIAGTAPLTIRAMTLRIQPSTEAVTVGKAWRGGMGHSGCQFVDHVGLTPSSVPLDQIAATATLEETGAYL